MTTNPVVIHTTQENAQSALDLTNQFLAEAGAKDAKGNPLVIKGSVASPTWLMFLARGQQATEWQERGTKIYNALNIQECEAEQVENLALLSGVSRRQRTSSFVTVEIKNNEASAITINSRNSVFTDSVYSYEWYIGQNVTLASMEVARVQLYCASTTNVELQRGVAFNATPLIEGIWAPFTCLSLTPSIEGTKEETIAELRNRVIVGTSSYSMVNKTEDAISQLEGVSKCAIYFNEKALDSKELAGGITLPPRTCLVLIRGADANDLIAKTYFEYMDVQSYDPGSSFNVLTSYVRVGALNMPVHYMQCTAKKVYVRVTVNASASDVNYASYIREALSKYTDTTNCGENITSKMVSVWLNDVIDYVDVIGVEVSDDGETWSNITDIPCFNYATIDLDNISYVTD